MTILVRPDGSSVHDRLKLNSNDVSMGFPDAAVPVVILCLNKWTLFEGKGVGGGVGGGREEEMVETPLVVLLDCSKISLNRHIIVEASVAGSVWITQVEVLERMGSVLAWVLCTCLRTSEASRTDRT